MIELDIHYASNMSLRLDLKIVLKTFPVLWARFAKCRQEPQREKPFRLRLVPNTDRRFAATFDFLAKSSLSESICE